jgi:hypothetical protein
MMPLAAIMVYIRLAGLIIQYGWKLVAWFKDRHDRIEEEAKLTVMTSESKAKLFNRGAFNDISHATQKLADTQELNTIREAVWAASNPGKQPKPLADVRLRVRRKVGKSARG